MNITWGELTFKEISKGVYFLYKGVDRLLETFVFTIVKDVSEELSSDYYALYYFDEKDVPTITNCQGLMVLNSDGKVIYRERGGLFVDDYGNWITDYEQNSLFLGGNLLISQGVLINFVEGNEISININPKEYLIADGFCYLKSPDSLNVFKIELKTGIYQKI